MSQIVYKQVPFLSNRSTNGYTQWNHLPDDKYMATGVDRNNKRFKIVSDSYDYIRGLNLWRGTKWLLRNGKRHRIQSVTN